MKLSESQFSGVDESARQSFLEKRLWVRENYEVRPSVSLLDEIGLSYRPPSPRFPEWS